MVLSQEGGAHGSFEADKKYFNRLTGVEGETLQLRMSLYYALRSEALTECLYGDA